MSAPRSAIRPVLRLATPKPSGGGSLGEGKTPNSALRVRAARKFIKAYKPILYKGKLSRRKFSMKPQNRKIARSAAAEPSFGHRLPAPWSAGWPCRSLRAKAGLRPGLARRYGRADLPVRRPPLHSQSSIFHPPSRNLTHAAFFSSPVPRHPSPRVGSQRPGADISPSPVSPFTFQPAN